MIRRHRPFKLSGLLLGAVLAVSVLALPQAPGQKKEEKPAPAQATVPITTEDLNQFAWRWIGPVDFLWTHHGIRRPPRPDPNLLCPDGQRRPLEDRGCGIHFEPIFDKYGNMSMGYLAIAPSDPKILYLGTGEPMHARASAHGNGLWKSTDAGKTWVKAGLEKSFFIPKVAVDPKNPDIAYARPRASSTTMRWTASGASSKRPTAARPGRTSSRSRTAASPTSSSTRATRTSSSPRPTRRSAGPGPTSTASPGTTSTRRPTAARPGRN